MEVIWKDVVGYEGLYKVNNLGEVMALNYRTSGTSQFIKQYGCEKSYTYVMLHKEGHFKRCKLHRIVAEAFIPNPESKPSVDHINRNKSDNRPENLRWVTQSENMANEETRKRDKKRGILQRDCNGKIIRHWKSAYELSRYLGVGHRRMKSILLGTRESPDGFFYREINTIDEEAFNQEEEWKDIPEYEGLYQISTKGNVRKILQNGLFRKINPIDEWYMRIRLNKNGKRKYYLVHRLVAKTFIPNPENKPEVDHINTDKKDNRVENLRWVSRVENMNNKETKNKIKHNKVYQYNLYGDLVSTYSSATEAANINGLKYKDVIRTCAGKFRTITSKGYIWSYSPEPPSVELIEKIKNCKCKKILQYSMEGTFIKQWDSIKEAAESIGVSRSSLSKSIGKETRSSGGYKWEFKK